jgi:hypothetical protein
MTRKFLFVVSRNKEDGIRNRFHSAVLFASLLACIFVPITALSQSPGTAPSVPAPTGKTVEGIVECGEGYTSHELYDMKITLLEVIRGESAWNRIKEADAANKRSESGTEYVLARVRFEYHAKGKPGLCIHHLAPNQFTAYSAGGEDYKPASVIPPKPELRKELKSGDAFEGWLAFAVAREDKAPLISYSVDAGGAVQHGESKWFLLR